MRHFHIQENKVMRSLGFYIMALMLSVGYCSAGQSLQMLGGPVKTFSDPNRSQTLPYRLELQIHSFTPPQTSSTFLRLNGVGVEVRLLPSGDLWVLLNRDTVTGGNPCILPLNGRTNVLVRIQRDPANMIYHCEAWNADGGGYFYTSQRIVSFNNWTLNGGAIGDPNLSASLGFVRTFTAIVPVKSTPPATANQGDWIDFKLDGNGNDSSGHGGDFNASGFTFSQTPGQAAIALPTTPGTPEWAPFIPLRAGHPSKLASNSYSMADGSSAVTCFWQQLEGPSMVLFDNRTSCSPTLTGVIFGPYKFRLVVTDVAGVQGSADLEVGAVVYDDKGVVIYPDDRLNTLLGPAKVLGQNDYEWYDQRLTFLAQENWKHYEINGGPWFLEQEKQSIGGVPRNGTIYATHDDTKIYGIGTNFLRVFCGGRVGPALKSSFSPYVVALIPQGEGVAPNPYARIVESCQSDTELTMISGWNWGADTVNSPGVPWGTYGMANFRQDGSGTVYTNKTVSDRKIYGAGTDFLARFCGGTVGPTAINGPGIIVFENSKSTRLNVESCQSDTELTLASYSPWTGSDVMSPGVAWGYETESNGSWNVNGNTINYYDVALGLYKLYYRSGWGKARDAARWLSDRYYRAQGILGGSGRALSPISAVLRHTVDTEGVTYPNFWPFFRSHVDYLTTNVNPPGCMTTRVGDFREDSYCVLLIALQALYETSDTERAKARTRLATIYDNSVLDQQPDGSYFNEDAGLIPGQGAPELPVVTMTHGSATVTLHQGPNFSEDFCGVPGSFQEAGTIAMTNGSRSVVGPGTNFTGAAGKRIFIRGTYNGQPYSQLNGVAAVADSTHLTLEFPWPGPTETATDYRIQSKSTGPYFDTYAFGVKSVNASGYATGAAVVDEDNWYWCTRDSGTQLTLDKPYTGDTSTNSYRKLMNGFAGRGSQPFMMGLGARAFHVAAKALDGFDDTRAAGYRTAASRLVDYLYNYASAPYSHRGVPYFTHYAPCFPQTSIPNACDDVDDPNYRRDFMVETNAAFALDYLANPTPERRTQGDAWLNAQFARPGLTGFAAGDGHHANLIDNCCWSFNLTKFTGQTFGMGGGDMWAAARLGGPDAPQELDVSVGFNLGSVPNAAQAKINLTSPSGATSEFDCGDSSPCSATIDRRQGSHWLRLKYFSESGQLLSESEPQLITVP